MILICTHNILESQLCIDGRFTEVNYFTDDEIIFDTDVSYGLANDWYYDMPAPLLNTFNIAYPAFGSDPLEKRPLVVLAHGGGFWGGEKENMDYIIQQLAQKGYVAVSANYRKGWDAYGDPEDCDGDGNSMYQAIYKAMQDLQASVRYLVENADTYAIDTSWIFLGGQSAGVYAMMNSTYITQEEWDSMFPEHTALFGSLNSATNDIEINYTIKGFINFWGGMLDTAFIDENDVLPTISFFGTEDEIVPPYEGNFQGCEQYAYVYGSASISEKLNSYNICNVLHKREGYGHETYEDDYVIGNAACFMKSIFCDDCSVYEVDYQLAACGDVIANEIVGSYGLAEKVYPNPADKYVVVETADPLESTFTLDLYNVMGNKIQVSYTSAGHTVILQTESIPTGIYYFTLHSGYIHTSGSFIINK